MSEKEIRYCPVDGRPFTVPPSAPHKRFCSARCRQEWHQEEARRAMELLRTNQTKENTQ